MPVTPVACQPRGFDREDGTHLTLADRGQQPIKAGTCHAAAGTTEVIIHNRHFLPTKQLRPLTQTIEASASFSSSSLRSIENRSSGDGEVASNKRRRLRSASRSTRGVSRTVISAAPGSVIQTGTWNGEALDRARTK